MASGQKQVYIVDKDESICRSLKFLVATYGFEVRTFTSAEDFFSAVPNRSPGCLILDINLSGITGWEAHQRLIEKGSNRPVVLMTADQSDGLKERALQGGALGFFRKPIDKEELVQLIHQAASN